MEHPMLRAAAAAAVPALPMAPAAVPREPAEAAAPVEPAREPAEIEAPAAVPRELAAVGDTLVADGRGGHTFTASDSAALGDFAQPLMVHDKNVNAQEWPQEWIPLNAAEQANGGLSQFAMGGTNVVEYAPNKGLVWFLKNHRGGGADNIVGAGVATVTADNVNGPIAVRAMDTMWASYEPYWGDIGVTYNALDGHVYVFGHGPTALSLKTNVFLAKVPAEQATEIGAYQYWDQSKKAWTAQRYGNGQNGTVSYSSAQAIFTYAGHGQSNAFWSNHYDTWMFVYGADWPDSDIYVSTASKLEGPWSNAVSIDGPVLPRAAAATYATASRLIPSSIPAARRCS